MPKILSKIPVQDPARESGRRTPCRLITPIGPAGIQSSVRGIANNSLQLPVAPFLPGLARRFPYFAVLWTRLGVSFRCNGAGKRGDCHMTIKASGRSALILAAGIWICFAGSSRAASGDTAAAGAKSQSPGAPVALVSKHAARHWKKVARHQSDKQDQPGKQASKATDNAQPAPTDVAADNGDRSAASQSPDIPQSSDIPPSVANANAQLASGDTTVGAAGAMSARANAIAQTAAAGAQIVAPDQLNDVDRALHESNPSDSRPAAMPIAMVSTDAAPAAAAVAANDSSSLDRTSLIGKIFIGFGALLTMASAVRMFIA
jgi:hypothetical protein